MDEVGWRERMERTDRAIGAYALAGSLILGPALPGHEEFHHPPEAAFPTPVVLPAHDRAASYGLQMLMIGLRRLVHLRVARSA